jgi:hypothetical protein
MKLINKTVDSFKNLKPHEFILVILLLSYLISGVSTPYELSSYVNNTFMHLSLVAFAIILFLYGSPLLALLFVGVACVFVFRCGKVSHDVMKPSQKKNDRNMSELNTHLTKTSLEEELVGQVVRNPENIPGPSSFHPVLCDSHNASKV